MDINIPVTKYDILWMILIILILFILSELIKYYIFNLPFFYGCSFAQNMINFTINKTW